MTVQKLTKNFYNTKICSMCMLEKSLKDFLITSSYTTKDGSNYYKRCQSCRNINNKKRKKINGKICKHCQKPLVGTQSKYCSNKCYSEANKKYKERSCEWCGKKLNRPQLQKYQSFCSRKCYAFFIKSKRITKICEFCGMTFDVYKQKEKQRFCSNGCRNNFSKSQKIAKICEICKTNFTVSKQNKIQKDQKFCSQKCQHIAHNVVV